MAHLPDTSNRFSGYLAALGATIIWAGNFVAARALAEVIPPFQFNFWRWCVAFIALLPFAWKSLKTDWPCFIRNFGFFSIMAIIGVTLMNAFVYKAGQTTESLNMALIMPATPVIIILLARIFYDEKIGLARLAGIAISITGLLLLVFRGNLKKLTQLDFTAGDLWTVGGMLCFAIYSILMRKKPEGMNALGFNAYIFGLGLLYTFPCVLLEINCLSMPSFSWAMLTGILYSGIGCSAIAFWLWTIGVERIGPISSGLVYYSLPIFAAIMGFIILGETITLSQILGGILIILGILIATLNTMTHIGQHTHKQAARNSFFHKE